MLKYYANINGTNEGPYTLDELKDLVASNKISPKTYVLLEGTDKWIKRNEYLLNLIK